MNLLLDTHVALWAITDDVNLGDKARELISSPANEIWVSVASIWEIAIKHSLGRGDMPVSGKDAARYFQGSGYLLLPVEAEHAVAVESLPALHADPFDRILVAQALTEPLRLLTRDAKVLPYSDTIIEA